MKRVHTALELERVSVVRGKKTLVQSLSLTLAAGEILGVLGPNGAGKTSLLSVCSGELESGSGEIRLSGTLMNRANAGWLARTRAVLPQQSALTFNLPITQIIEMGAYPFPEIDHQTIAHWTECAIAQTDLASHIGKPYDALSGGEQQRVQFARVLLQTWAIADTHGHACLFLDEPTASLDLKHQSLLIKALRTLLKHQSTAVFVILHDLNMAARICDKVLLLSPTHPPVYGTPQTVFNETRLEQTYGIRMRIERNPLRTNELMILTDDE
jgi:iron complex transport system ATP-binding protein